MYTPIANVLAPHYCCSCGAIGSVLCDSCKYDITSDPYEACMLCHRLASGSENVCSNYHSVISHGWAVGSRTGALKEVIDIYKFERAQVAYKDLAQLLDSTLPHLPPDILVTTVPTIAKHIRVRGFDHMRHIGREFARMRHLPYEDSLNRITATVQHGVGRRLRESQAKVAFAPRHVVDGARYLLVDDICTTGSTLTYAAKTLLQAGAHEVWVAVIAVQPLEKD